MVSIDWKLLTLWVTFGLLIQCNTNALSLSQKNSAPVVSVLSNEESMFYDHEGRHCRMCPPGYFVSGHCEITGTNSTCKPCSNDSYSTHWNSFRACVPCKICRSGDQVTLKQCFKTNNAECACKEGKFCSPSQPCETCHKCKTSCPDGEEMVQPCTPKSDIQCVPVSTSSPTVPPGGSGPKTHTVLASCGVLVVLVLFLGYMMWKCKKTHWCCFRGRATRTRANSFFSKTLLWLQTKFAHGQPESEDNERNTELDQIPSGPRRRQPDETSPLQEQELSIPIEEERRRLVPADGNDPADALRQSFVYIKQEVPHSMWHSYMLVLGLTYNEIEIAKADASSVAEQHLLMLQKWQEKNGKNATLDALLKKLCDPPVNLKGVEMRIREALISSRLYVYEE